VALKILSESFARNPEWSDRFRQEAVLLASINHPNIATVHSLESEGPVTFITMELIEGTDLGTLLHRGALGVGEALSIARQVARGLEAAHRQSLIHRDLKPNNVMITTDALAERLTRVCPEVSTLATSREPLGLGGEVVYSLAPLPTPHAKASSLEQIRSADSVELFCARAAQVRPDFALSEDNA